MSACSSPLTLPAQQVSRGAFARFAWIVLGYTLLVVLGGAFVRATVSGDGCGQHWPDCRGSLLPEGGPLATYIELSHRASTGLLLAMILLMAGWAWRCFPAGHAVRRAAIFSLSMTLVEAGIGAGLVLWRLVAHDKSLERAIAMPAHLIATFLLLAGIGLTAWWGSGRPAPDLRGQRGLAFGLLLAIAATLAVGVTGAISALGDTLFPAQSLEHGLRQDLDPRSHFLLRLRIYHPLMAITAGLVVALLAGLAARLRPSKEVRRLATGLLLIYLGQMLFGALNLWLMAPLWMQFVHLLIADLFWLNLLMLCAAALAAGAPRLEVEAAPGGRPRVQDYVALTKPRVISLLLLTTLFAMWIAASGAADAPAWWQYLAVAAGFYAAAGAANCINMVLERDLDERMGRTRGRPLVTSAVSGDSALTFAFALMLLSLLILWMSANLLCAMLALGGLAFYVLVYTMLLKRRTWQNIVIGGAAGAFPPLVGWAAAANNLSPLAWCLFGLIFLWTPVHFWALAILLKDDYALAGVPMLPVVRGVRATVNQIAAYALLTAGISALPLIKIGGADRPEAGWIYLIAVMLLNLVLLARSYALFRRPEERQARSLFHYSMVYLALLFLALAVDRSVLAQQPAAVLPLIRL